MLTKHTAKSSHDWQVKPLGHKTPYLDGLSAFTVTAMMSTHRAGRTLLTRLGVVSSRQGCFYISHINGSH